MGFCRNSKELQSKTYNIMYFWAKNQEKNYRLKSSTRALVFYRWIENSKRTSQNQKDLKAKTHDETLYETRS